jgi:hypothetical protein
MGAQEAIICATFAACNSSVVTGELWTTKSEGSAATVPESGVAPPWMNRTPRCARVRECTWRRRHLFEEPEVSGDRQEREARRLVGRPSRLVSGVTASLNHGDVHATFAHVLGGELCQR